jgi:nucleoside-diphosphate-sugar epimerase
LHANRTPLGALPARFRKPRLLIVGCGDVGQRVATLLTPRMRVLALTSQSLHVPSLRALGTTPLVGNLDQAHSLRRLAGLASRVLHLAPPPPQGSGDPRTQALLNSLRKGPAPAVFLYGSTSGVYGDCAGQEVAETQACQAQTPRARRRVHAEQQIRNWALQHRVRASILRIPGIYAKDREGGTPHQRLRQGTPVLQAQDDVYTNHIHADDLARACVAALWRGRGPRSYNINDDTVLPMGDYFDLAADLYQLPRPPRISLAQATERLSPMQLSFMRESRRLINTRMKQELRLQLRYPHVRQGLV